MKLRTSSILAIAAIALVTLFASAVQSAQSGLAYDEVSRMVMGQAAPAPGSFATDFQAAVNAQRAVSGGGTHGGLFGSIMNAVDTAKNAMNVFKTGTALTQYYLSGWRRSDDVGAQTATIDKPQQQQLIYLDLAKHTYRLQTGGFGYSDARPPEERMRNPSGQPAQPGSGRLDVTASVQSLGPLTIDNVPTTGYRSVFSMRETQSSGSCADGSFQVSTTEYLSPYLEPRVASGGAAVPRRSTLRPEMMALKPGCRPTIVMHASGGRVPSGRLAMWSLVTISGDAPSAQGPMSGGFSVLTERGNIRALSAADKGLFEIPAGFTQTQ
ncbi:MAG: hypothetical protein JO193_03815 [Candidatus Eremiobacteraeota bacterium]|nr:hypothetical protein [Candidatus Eremiobacteraeota bacterium]